MLTNAQARSRLIPLQWVFKTKRDGTKKARLVVVGCAQRPRVNFDQTHCSTLKATSLRFLAATAAIQGLHMRRFDFVSAFLQGDLEPGEQIACRPPPDKKLFLAMFEKRNGQNSGNSSPSIRIYDRNRSNVVKLVGREPLMFAKVENGVTKSWAVPMTESEWVPVVCANDEVAKCRRTGITRADTEDMLSRERTHGLHDALLTRR